MMLFWDFLALAAVGCLAYTYVGYPLLLGAISLFRPKNSAVAGYTPKLTLVIAAYNEEASIEAKLRNTLSLNYPPELLEIVVASDASDDNTDLIVKRLASEDARIRLVRAPIRRGKTNAQNLAVPHASGDIVVFSDAAALYDPQALMYLAANYRDPKVGAVSGRYVYYDPGSSPTAFGSSVFWGFENTIKLLQSRISTLGGCSGCIYSVRRDLYVPLPIDACSDLVEPLAVIQKGYRVVFEPRAVAAEAATGSQSEEFRMRVRVVDHGIHALFSMREMLKIWKYGWISFQLFSHKVMRWSVPLFLFLLLLGTFMGRAPWSQPLLILQLAFYAMALIALVSPPLQRYRILTLPLYFCTLNCAIIAGLSHLIRGNRFAVWETIRPNAQIVPNENTVPNSK